MNSLLLLIGFAGGIVSTYQTFHFVTYQHFTSKTVNSSIEDYKNLQGGK